MAEIVKEPWMTDEMFAVWLDYYYESGGAGVTGSEARASRYRGSGCSDAQARVSRPYEAGNYVVRSTAHFPSSVIYTLPG